MPCFTSTTSVSYINNGFTTQNNVTIFVELPDSISPIYVSHSYYIDSSGLMVFTIGSLQAGESGIITIIDSMACELSLSNTQACTKAWISPANTCYNNFIDPTPWDSSNIIVEGAAIIIDGDNCFQFTIINTGESMVDSFSYSIYSGVGLIQIDSFLLASNNGLVITVCGVDYAQILINQHINHPLTKTLFFEPPTQDSTIISIYDFIEVDNQFESSVECLTVVNAFVPNDKNATPNGWGDANYVHPNTLLDYKIRFQNTGNDTAYNIEILDTINVSVFDVSKLILGNSSHPYEFEVSGDSGIVVFHFNFDDINLVDSFANEPLSHGFVNFKIGAYDTIAEGTIANNFADIYFDYNPAIRTNTSMVTLQDTIPLDKKTTIVIGIDSLEKLVSIKDRLNANTNWSIYPNPTSSSFSISIENNNMDYSIEVVNTLGQKIHTNDEVQIGKTFQTKNWSSGIYYVSLTSEAGEFLGSKKIVVSK